MYQRHFLLFTTLYRKSKWRKLWHEEKINKNFGSKNICSVPLEWTCSEVEKLAGEVSFLRAKFSFPRSNGPFSRSDSCQNRAKRDFGSPDREKKTIWSRKWKFWLEERKKPKSFTTEEASQFQRHRYIFFAADTRWPHHTI